MTKKIRVLQFSTHNEDCGIAKYQEQFIAEMIAAPEFHTEFFEYSPNVIKKMDSRGLQQVIRKLKRKLKEFDILHIQHEYSFFNSSELMAVIRAAKGMRKRVIVTVHTAPEAQYKHPVRAGLGPGSWKLYARQIVSARKFKKKYIDPLLLVDLVIVHNSVTRESLERFGVKGDRIRIIRIPVPEAEVAGETYEIRKALNYKKGDVIFCTVGFISESKGILQAIKSLKYLPANYKLAIIGGIHPQGGNEKFLDQAADLIDDLGFKERVYITGFVEDDRLLNSLIRECDICVYPFDKKYYSYVSSASLNNAIANHKPIIAYHTRPFEEASKEIPFISFTKSPNYYELARTVRSIDIEKSQELSRQYAERYSYTKEAREFLKIYEKLAS